MSEDKRRIEVNWVQSAAGALAAVTSAVLLSTVGIVGTLIGAALGSIVATVGGAVYSYSIATTKDRVASTRTLATARIGRARSRAEEASEDLEAGTPGADQELAAAGEDPHSSQENLDESGEDVLPADEDPDKAGEGPHGAGEDLDEAGEQRSPLDWKAVLAGLPWKRIAVVATGIFVSAMLVILTFELVTGRAVSAYTGGSDPDRRTSIPGLGSGGGAGDGDQDPQRPAPEQAPGDAPDDGARDLEQPDSTPTADTEETAEPRLEDEPAETETAEPTPASTPTPVPSEPVEPAPSP